MGRIKKAISQIFFLLIHFFSVFFVWLLIMFVYDSVASPSFKGDTNKRKLVDFKPLKAEWLNNHPEIKHEIDKTIAKAKAKIKSRAEDFFKEYPKSGLLPFKFHIEEIKLFKHKDQDVVSVRLITYAYTGGAHGGKNYYSWNWSKTKKIFVFE